MKEITGVVDPQVFRMVRDLVKHMVDEAKIQIRRGGLSLRVVDPAHVQMCIIDITGPQFDGEGEIGIDLETLNGLLEMWPEQKMVPTSSGRAFVPLEQVQMIFKPGPDFIGSLVIEGGGKRAEMDLPNPTVIPDPKPPKLTLPAKIFLDPSEVQRVVRVAMARTDHIKVAYEDGKTTIGTDEAGDSDVEQTWIAGEWIEGKAEKKRVMSRYSADYLHNTVEGLAKHFRQIEIRIGEDYPIDIRAEESLMPRYDGKVEVRYLIAPRIESG